MHLLRALLLCSIPLSTWAAPPVYRCETQGKVSYSDAPCVGAKAIDATPTQGMDKMSGRSLKGKEVQAVEFHKTLDQAWQPLTGRSHDEMDVLRRRSKLNGSDQLECTRLDGRLPGLEAGASGAAGGAKAQAEVELYKARKRYFDLQC